MDNESKPKRSRKELPLPQTPHLNSKPSNSESNLPKRALLPILSSDSFTPIQSPPKELSDSDDPLSDSRFLTKEKDLNERFRAAAVRNNVKKMNRLIRNFNVNINSEDDKQRSALILSVLHKCHDSINFLVQQHGVNIDHRGKYQIIPRLQRTNSSALRSGIRRIRRNFKTFN